MGSVAVIGAGPYGLSTAAYLRGAGLETHVFGEPMESWEKHMPAGMKLRSGKVATHIAHPGGDLGIETWAAETGAMPGEPLTRAEFVAYGLWFQQRAVPEVDRRRVRNIELGDGSFSLRLEDGQQLEFRHVVVATGIAPFASRPPLFEDLPAELVTHAADHPSLESFAGKSVLVVGAGQSALETAALLSEDGARPELVARVSELSWLAPHMQAGFKAEVLRLVVPPTNVGGPRTGWLAAAPKLFRSLPKRTQAWVYGRCTKAIGADWLRPRLQDVPVELGRTITEASPNGDSIAVRFDDGVERSFDHVILGTGYRIDVGRYGFLSQAVLDRLETVGGSARELGVAPWLKPDLQSSVPGLYFAGATAAATLGPIMRFVVGTWYAAPAVSRSISGVRQGPMYFSYRPRGPRIRGKAPAG